MRGQWLRVSNRPQDGPRPQYNVARSDYFRTVGKIRRTAMRRRARPRWRRSLRAGDGNRAALPLARPLARSIALDAAGVRGELGKRASGLPIASQMLPATDLGSDRTLVRPMLWGLLGKRLRAER